MKKKYLEVSRTDYRWPDGKKSRASSNFMLIFLPLPLSPKC